MSTPTPIQQDPSFAWPCFAEDETAAVEAVLRSGRVNYWTGQETRLFESEYASALGRRHAVALANGTVALESCLQALGIGPGDEVVVPCRTFVATAMCVAMRGAHPVFADVDLESQNITAASVAECLTPRTRAVIVVHLAGWPAEMEPILSLAAISRFAVIEDCAQCHGARYRGRPAGSFGMMAALSFCQDKIVTTGGEGGLIATDDSDAWSRAWSFKDHGKSFDTVYNQRHPPGFRWLHESIGTNWRLTEMQAAIGRIQLKRLDASVAARRRHAEYLNSELAGLAGLRLTFPPADVLHSYYKYYAFVRPDRLREGWCRDRIMSEIQAHGVPCGSGSCGEIYLERAFPAEWRPNGRLSGGRELSETSLMFLVHPTLSDRALKQTAWAIAEVLRRAAQ